MKPSELRKGDVVCYGNGRFPFGDMEVVKVGSDGVLLRRPYITETGEAAFEELCWRKDSNFEFRLLDTEDYDDLRLTRNRIIDRSTVGLAAVLN